MVTLRRRVRPAARLDERAAAVVVQLSTDPALFLGELSGSRDGMVSEATRHPPAGSLTTYLATQLDNSAARKSANERDFRTLETILTVESLRLVGDTVRRPPSAGPCPFVRFARLPCAAQERDYLSCSSARRLAINAALSSGNARNTAGP